jgi:ComF family protein
MLRKSTLFFVLFFFRYIYACPVNAFFMWKDLMHLIFPAICPACEEALPAGDSAICPSCFAKLPGTGFHLISDNPAQHLFAGRFPFHWTGSAYHFEKGGSVQRILHEIKYRSGLRLAEQLGAAYGNDLRNARVFPSNPVFIPVPLHPLKQHRRGYNQALFLARGLASSFPSARVWEGLQRTKDTDSQTKKGRFARWQNVEEVFTVNGLLPEAGSHPVLVDDVLTTGATLEACARALRNAGMRGISAVTLAYAG